MDIPEFTYLIPGGSDGKASVYNAGDPGSSPGLGRYPGEGNGNSLQYYCLEKSHGQRSLVGYSLWGCKESDTTEQLHFTLHASLQSFLRAMFSKCPIIITSNADINILNTHIFTKCSPQQFSVICLHLQYV